MLLCSLCYFNNLKLRLENAHFSCFSSEDASCFIHALLIPNATQGYNKTLNFNLHYFYVVVGCCAITKPNYLWLFVGMDGWMEWIYYLHWVFNHSRLTRFSDPPCLFQDQVMHHLVSGPNGCNFWIFVQGNFTECTYLRTFINGRT